MAMSPCLRNTRGKSEFGTGVATRHSSSCSSNVVCISYGERKMKKTCMRMVVVDTGRDEEEVMAMVETERRQRRLQEEEKLEMGVRVEGRRRDRPVGTRRNKHTLLLLLLHRQHRRPRHMPVARLLRPLWLRRQQEEEEEEQEQKRMVVVVVVEVVESGVRLALAKEASCM